MMETLIIRIVTDAAGDPLAQWALFRGPDRVVAAEQPASFDETFARLPVPLGQNRRTIVLLPAADITLTEIIVPPAQRRHQDQILSSLIEDRLAEDVGSVHLACGPALDAAGRTPVAIIRAALMTRWADELRDAGIEPHMMISEIFALPASDADQWRMLYDGQSLWLRTGTHAGLAVEPDALPVVLPMFLKDAMRPIDIDCVLTDGGSEAELLDLPSALTLRCVAWSGSAFDYMSRMSLQTFAGDAPAINLLQGAFAPRSVKTGADRKTGIVMRLAAATFLLALLLNGGQAVYVSMRAQAKQAQIINLYRHIFPADTKLVDPVQQMKNHLSAQQSPDGAGFLSILKLTAARIGTDHPLDLQTLAYSEEGRKLTMDITGQSIENLNTLAQRIDGGALSARLVSVAKDNDVVQAQLSVQLK